ncbi:MAG: YraN family protein [Armatimonadetes bacterium]|nr:YraN family protein [Armatimonadota bacterium]
MIRFWGERVVYRSVLRLLATAVSSPELLLAPSERRRIPSAESRSRDGAAAEDLAAVYLALRGYRILCRHRVNSLGELDIVARKGRTLVLVEVRSRRAGSPVSARNTLTAAKRRRLAGCAELFRREHGLVALPWRIDLLAVEFPAKGMPRVAEHLVDCIGDQGRP